MKLAEKIIALNEGKHFNTKVRGIESSKKGSRVIRLAVKEAKKMVSDMMNKSHPSPNPKTEKDNALLNECGVLMHQTMERLKEVKESKYRK